MPVIIEFICCGKLFRKNCSKDTYDRTVVSAGYVVSADSGYYADADSYEDGNEK